MEQDPPEGLRSCSTDFCKELFHTQLDSLRTTFRVGRDTVPVAQMGEPEHGDPAQDFIPIPAPASPPPP